MYTMTFIWRLALFVYESSHYYLFTQLTYSGLTSIKLLWYDWQIFSEQTIYTRDF